MNQFKARFLKLPQTKLGLLAVFTTIIYVILLLMKMNGLINLPTFGIMALGILGGLLNILAIIWRREVSWLNWLFLFPGLFAILFSAGEILAPH